MSTLWRVTMKCERTIEVSAETSDDAVQAAHEWIAEGNPLDNRWRLASYESVTEE